MPRTTFIWLIEKELENMFHDSIRQVEIGGSYQSHKLIWAQEDERIKLKKKNTFHSVEQIKRLIKITHQNCSIKREKERER